MKPTKKLTRLILNLYIWKKNSHNQKKINNNNKNPLKDSINNYSISMILNKNPQILKKNNNKKFNKQTYKYTDWNKDYKHYKMLKKQTKRHHEYKYKASKIKIKYYNNNSNNTRINLTVKINNQIF